jgi:hypothetical protein
MYRVRATEPNIYDDLLESPASQYRIDTVADGGALYQFVERSRAFHLKLKVVTALGSLTRNHVGCRRLLVVVPSKVHILGRPSPRPESEVQGKSTLQHPTTRRHDHKACQKSFKDDLLSHADQRQTCRP